MNSEEQAAVEAASTEEFVFEHTPIDYHELEQRGLDLVCTSCTTKHSQVGFFQPGESLWRDADGNYRKISAKEDFAMRTN